MSERQKATTPAYRANFDAVFRHELPNPCDPPGPCTPAALVTRIPLGEIVTVDTINGEVLSTVVLGTTSVYVTKRGAHAHYGSEEPDDYPANIVDFHPLYWRT